MFHFAAPRPLFCGHLSRVAHLLLFLPRHLLAQLEVALVQPHLPVRCIVAALALLPLPYFVRNFRAVDDALHKLGLVAPLECAFLLPRPALPLFVAALALLPLSPFVREFRAVDDALQLVVVAPSLLGDVLLPLVVVVVVVAPSRFECEVALVLPLPSFVVALGVQALGDVLLPLLVVVAPSLFECEVALVLPLPSFVVALGVQALGDVLLPLVVVAPSLFECEVAIVLPLPSFVVSLGQALGDVALPLVAYAVAVALPAPPSFSPSLQAGDVALPLVVDAPSPFEGAVAPVLPALPSFVPFRDVSLPLVAVLVLLAPQPFVPFLLQTGDVVQDLFEHAVVPELLQLLAFLVSLVQAGDDTLRPIVVVVAFVLLPVQPFVVADVRDLEFVVAVAQAAFVVVSFRQERVAVLLLLSLVVVALVAVLQRDLLAPEPVAALQRALLAPEPVAALLAPEGL
jgi:hypothetical protein